MKNKPVSKKVGAQDTKQIFLDGNGVIVPMIEDAPIAIAIATDMKFLYANRQFLEMFGVADLEELERMKIYDLVAARDREIFTNRVIQREKGLAVDAQYEVTGVRKDGTEFPIAALVKIMNLPDGTATVGYFQDITERKHTEELLHYMNRELRAISDCNQVLVRAEDEQTLLNDVCRIICEEAGYRMAWVGYALNDETKTVFPAAKWGADDGYLDTIQITWTDNEFGRGPTGTAIRTGTLAIAPDYEKDDRLAPWREQAVQRGYHSSIALPLLDDKGIAFGALTIYSAEKHIFILEECRLLEELAGDLAFGIRAIRNRAERKQAEEQLKITNKQLEDIIEFLPDATFIINEDKKVIAWNRAIEKMTGLSRKDIVGKDHTQCGIPFYGAPRKFLVDLLEHEDEHLSSQYNSVTRSGNTLYAEIYAPALYQNKGAYIWVITSPLLDASGKMVGAIESIRDITERKKVEDILRQSEERYRVLFSTMLNGFALHEIICDEKGKPFDYRFLDINPEFEKMTGLKKKEVIGKTVLEVLPGTESYWIDLYGEVALTGKSVRFENYAQALNKHFEVMVYSPQKYQFATLVSDITERKKAEETLKTSNRIFEHSIDMLCIAGFDGYLKVLNPAWSKTLGWSNEELMSKPWIEYVYPEDKEATSTIKGSLVEGKLAYQFKNRYLCKDGSIKWLSWNSYPYPEENIMFGVARDITEQKLLEEQLLQSQKMEAIGQLAGGIAHDFNNILQVISGHIEMLITEIPVDSSHQEDLEEISKATERAKSLVRQLLAFSRRQTLHLELVVINDLVNGLLKMIRRIIGENIELIFQPGDDATPLLADPSQVEQIILNLCVNARDAMRDGGKLIIETQTITIDSQYSTTHLDAHLGRYMVLSVSDTGQGIPTDIQHRIFEPFFTTKAVGEGTGLGLATVFAVTKRHSGFLNLYSEPGKGTTFKIYLPMPEVESVNQVSDNKVLEGELRGRGQTILLAEDDDQVRGLAKMILEKAGYRVLAAKDGDDAIFIFLKNTDQIDLALLDVMMPKKSGKQVMDKIRIHCPDLPIVFASGYNQNIFESDHLPDEGYELISKPYQKKELLKKIKEVLNRC